MGILFAPFTTVMYVLAWTPAGIQGWDWLWIILGVLLDVMKWGQIASHRQGAASHSQDRTPAHHAALHLALY